MYVFLFWAWVYWNIYFREMNLLKSYNYIKDNLDLLNNINIIAAGIGRIALTFAPFEITLIILFIGMIIFYNRN